LQAAHRQLIGLHLHICALKQYVLPAGVATTTPAIPEYSNCYIQDPQPVYQVHNWACPSAAASNLLLNDTWCCKVDHPAVCIWINRNKLVPDKQPAQTLTFMEAFATHVQYQCLWQSELLAYAFVLYKSSCFVAVRQPSCHQMCFGALQNGSYVPGRQIQSTQNVSEYSVFPFADLEGYDDMTPTLGTCFANTTGLSINPTLTGLVDACTQQTGLCCYTASGAADQVNHV